MQTPRASEFPLLRFERKIWPAFIAALLILLALIVTVAWRQDFFAPTIHLVCRTNTSVGLQENMQVKVSGFRIGKVRRVELEGIDQVTFDLDIFTKYSHMVHRNSVAMLGSEGFIGQGVIVIVASPDPGPPIASGDELRFRRVDSVVDMAQGLIQRAQVVTDDVHNMLTLFNAPDGLIHNLSSATKELDDVLPRVLLGIETTVQGLQKNLQETTSVTNQLLVYLNNPEGDVKQSVRSLKESMADIHQNIPGMLEKIDGSLRNIEQATATLRDTLKQASPDLVETVRGANDDVKGVHDILGSAKKIWPISKHLPGEVPLDAVPPSLPAPAAAATATEGGSIK
jgi:phospholipid/cholesterol/gamma-HCH transport system substrate-binding protein